MSERYEPSADFLRMMFHDEITLGDSLFGQENLKRLITFTKDNDPKNRDWATFYLSLSEHSTAEVIQALLDAAEDENEYVRGEAVLGLATRDKSLALPLVIRELGQELVQMQIFEAAEALADKSLIPYLERFCEPSGNSIIDDAVKSAFNACAAREEPTS